MSCISESLKPRIGKDGQSVALEPGRGENINLNDLKGAGALLRKRVAERGGSFWEGRGQANRNADLQHGWVS